LAQADQLQIALRANPGNVATRTLIFNAHLDAVLCGILLLLVAIVLLDSLRVWFGILRGKHEARISESPFVLSQLRPEEL
jgi:carbon starvation protein